MNGTDFLFGFSNSMFQSSKIGDCGQSNWTKAIESKHVTGSNIEISHWDNFKNDIKMMKEEYKVVTYRISIEWSHIEPLIGEYDENVLNKYKELAEYCVLLNIKPMFTLHHFNEPLWFHELGGFEKEENIEYFVRFCKYIFTNLHTCVKLWCTINEPAIYAFMGYIMGGFPPFYKLNPFKAMTVLKHLLIAHVNVYKELKIINNSNDIEIGIVHNVLLFRKRYYYDLIGTLITNSFNELTNDVLINFFRTGKFNYSGYFGKSIEYENMDAVNSNDFIGLNFYANPVVGPNLQNIYGATYFPNQDMGDMYLPIDPEGLSSAIDLVATLGKPIYITETGIADSTDVLRQKFLLQYLCVIDRKISDGVNIKGLYLWTFRDNYEWNQEGKLFGFHDIKGNKKESCNLIKSLFTVEEPNIKEIINANKVTDNLEVDIPQTDDENVELRCHNVNETDCVSPNKFDEIDDSLLQKAVETLDLAPANIINKVTINESFIDVNTQADLENRDNLQ